MNYLSFVIGFIVGGYIFYLIAKRYLLFKIFQNKHAQKKFCKKKDLKACLRSLGDCYHVRRYVLTSGYTFSPGYVTKGQYVILFWKKGVGKSHIFSD